jgi:hypothetical protein
MAQVYYALRYTCCVKVEYSQCEQDRQWMYIVMLTHICATIFAVAKQKVLHILSVCL